MRCTSNPTVITQLAVVVQQHVEQPLALHTLRLLVPKHGAVQLLQQGDRLLCDTGVQAGSRYILLGSYQSELQALEASKQAEASLRLPGFEYEAERAAARSTGAQAAGPGKHFFGSFKVLPHNPFAPPGAPPPSAALTLLHKLASDPAIAAVMERHGWTVPLLSEMPPEGKVGVSAMCILGYNVNNGQEISLRLRTDDYAGFRKYLAIRRTLVHELTHNVWSDHDINFKKLNSQLLKEVEQFEATFATTQTVAGIDTAFTPAAIPQQQQPARGRTLAEAAAADGQQQLLNHRALAAPELARAAALARWQEQQQQQQQAQAPSAGKWLGAFNAGQAISASAMDSATAAAPAAAAPAGDHGADTAAGSWNAAAEPAAVSFTDLQRYEHDDPSTAAAEEAAERLGSLQAGDVATGADAALEQPEALDVTQGQQQQQLLVAAVSPNPQSAGLQQGAPAGVAAEVFGSQQIVQDVAAEQQGQREEVCACGHAHTCMSMHDAPAAAPAAAAVVDAVPVEAMEAVSMDAAAVGGTAQHGSAVAADIASTPQQQAEAWSSEDAAAFEGLDSVLVAKIQQAKQLVKQLVQQSSGDVQVIGAASSESSLQQQQQTALQTLADVLSNLAAHPQEPRYRRLRCSNAAFYKKLGRFSAARQLLLLAGFAEQQQQQQQQTGAAGGVSEPVLVYVRDDPGLVWLVLSAVRDVLQA